MFFKKEDGVFLLHPVILQLEIKKFWWVKIHICFHSKTKEFISSCVCVCVCSSPGPETGHTLAYQHYKPSLIPVTAAVTQQEFNK